MNLCSAGISFSPLFSHSSVTSAATNQCSSSQHARQRGSGNDAATGRRPRGSPSAAVRFDGGGAEPRADGQSGGGDVRKRRGRRPRPVSRPVSAAVRALRRRAVHHDAFARRRDDGVQCGGGAGGRRPRGGGNHSRAQGGGGQQTRVPQRA